MAEQPPRPYLRAVATCQLDALTGEVQLLPHPSGRKKKPHASIPADVPAGAAAVFPPLHRSLERVVPARGLVGATVYQMANVAPASYVLHALEQA